MRTAIRSFKNVWNELDYAQRRLLEIRTGVPVTGTRRSRRSSTVQDLDALYAQPAHDPRASN